jgi:hypothetical protein
MSNYEKKTPSDPSDELGTEETRKSTTTVHARRIDRDTIRTDAMPNK